MLYLLAIICPPLAVLLCGRPGAFVGNVILTCLVWLPGMIHAFAIVSETKANQRTDKLARSLQADSPKAKASSGQAAAGALAMAFAAACIYGAWRALGH